jgi:hypothetical protein
MKKDLLKEDYIYLIYGKKWITCLIKHKKFRLAEKTEVQDTVRNWSLRQRIENLIKKTNKSMALIRWTGITNPIKYEKFLAGISTNKKFIRQSPDQWEKWGGYEKYPIIKISQEEFKKLSPTEKI